MLIQIMPTRYLLVASFMKWLQVERRDLEPHAVVGVPRFGCWPLHVFRAPGTTNACIRAINFELSWTESVCRLVGLPSNPAVQHSSHGGYMNFFSVDAAHRQHFLPLITHLGRKLQSVSDPDNNALACKQLFKP